MRSLIVSAVFLAATTLANAETRTVPSTNDFSTTVQKLRDAIEASPASIVYEMDHAANAESADMELRPTTLILFGNPTAGTQLMQADPAAGLSLPMKVLVVETDEGVELVYDDPTALAETYDLGEAAAVTDRMSGLLVNLTEAAAN